MLIDPFSLLHKKVFVTSFFLMIYICTSCRFAIIGLYQMLTSDYYNFKKIEWLLNAMKIKCVKLMVWPWLHPYPVLGFVVNSTWGGQVKAPRFVMNYYWISAFVCMSWEKHILICLNLLYIFMHEGEGPNFFYSCPSYFIRLMQFAKIFISMFISLNRIYVPLIPYATNF